MHHEGSASGSAPIPLSKKLQGLSRKQSKSCIFRVHKALREVNEEKYEPYVIGIGPYHRNKKSLQMMEEQKLHYFNSLLQLEKHNVEVYISAMKKEEEQVRNFYAEPLDLTSDELAEMMVLDGCFIIRFMIMKRDGFQQDDLFRELRWLGNAVKRDLMLYENQIPFFILRKLCGMTEISDENTLIDLLLASIPSVFPHHLHRWTNQHAHNEVEHLLDLIYLYWKPKPSSFPGANSNSNVNNNFVTIPCAIELWKAGVKIEKKDEHNFLEISFKSGILQIPPFDVYDDTEALLRNLLAHEQYCRRRRNAYVAYYLYFLDCLIDSTADVELLRKKGIIQNNIGDNELLAQLFNRILLSITFVDDDSSPYAGTFKRVNGYYNKRKNRWMAKLRRNYLNSPWRVISIIAASVLLLLTLTQTIFTIFPRIKYPKKGSSYHVLQKTSIFTCPICMDPFDEETSTKCGHIFCKECIDVAIAYQGKCPTCRRKMKSKDKLSIYLPKSC